MVGPTLLNADVTGRLETRGWSRARARPSRTLPVVGRRAGSTRLRRGRRCPSPCAAGAPSTHGILPSRTSAAPARCSETRSRPSAWVSSHPPEFCTWPPRTRNLPPYLATVIRWPARASSSRRRELSHSSDVPHRRLAEVPLVLAVEVRGIVVTDSVAGFRRVEIFAEHQPPGLLKPQLLLELQRTHRRHGSEVRMEPGHAHAQLSRDLVDPQRLVEVHAKFLDRANHAMRVTAERREVAQAAGLGTREQAIHDFANHERRQHTVLKGHVHEPHEPQRRVEHVRVERADIE